MQGENAERWRTLCELAATEQDPEVLIKLIEKIARLLDEKQQPLEQQRGQAAT